MPDTDWGETAGERARKLEVARRREIIARNDLAAKERAVKKALQRRDRGEKGAGQEFSIAVVERDSAQREYDAAKQTYADLRKGR